jgi:phospholipid/cholesterol/gamma-HCH transport system permease protein
MISTTVNQPSPHRPKGFGRIRRRKPWLLWYPVELLGHQLDFTWQTIRGSGHAVKAYRKETIVKFTDMTWGSGSIFVGGGVAAVLVVMGIAVGGMMGVTGYMILNMLGLGPLTGVMSAVANTRELVPIIAAIGFAAQAGCRITAEVGSMRISEEIDALEALAIRPIPYLVSTRVVAGLVTIVPCYVVALALTYLASQLSVTAFNGESPGAYGHYFHLFVDGKDIVFSLIKVVVLIAAVIIIHAYHGFYASGGPEGVGVACGKAIRASLVLIIVIDMILTIAMWGFSTTLTFSG